MKKYELTDDSITFMGRKLFRIRAIRSFNDVAAGDLGGYIEKEENLSHDNDAWISDNARISGNARISDKARIYGDARISGNACIFGNTCSYDNISISDNAHIFDDADYLYLKGLCSENRKTTFCK